MESTIRKLAQEEADKVNAKLMEARGLQKYFRVSKHNQARRLRFFARHKKDIK